MVTNIFFKSGIGRMLPKARNSSDLKYPGKALLAICNASPPIGADNFASISAYRLRRIGSLKGLKAYLDANTIIYTLEGVEPHLQTGLLLPLDAGEFTAVTSAISLLETVVGPRKRGDHQLV